jgi:hypothetical protein
MVRATEWENEAEPVPSRQQGDKVRVKVDARVIFVREYTPVNRRRGVSKCFSRANRMGQGKGCEM